ncbi:MAG TPA: hypothetical protein V6C57_18255, partial [Coleofasciculaceae cyanobacterium]
MADSYLFPATQSVDTQSIQVSRLETGSQPQLSQANQLTLLMSGGGLILVVVLAFYWWHRRRMIARSRRIATPIDWYQAEFGCGPLAADATIDPPLSAPVESSSSLQSTLEQPAPEQPAPKQPTP